MILIMNGRFQNAYWRNFSCLVKDELEALDVLTQWVAEGLLLEKATLVADQQQKELPVHLFNEASLRSKLANLQAEWHQLLDERPLATSLVDRQRQINSIRRRILYYEKQTAKITAILARLQPKLKRFSVRPKSGAGQALFEQWRLTHRRLSDHLSTITISQEKFKNLLQKLEPNDW